MNRARHIVDARTARARRALLYIAVVTATALVTATVAGWLTSAVAEAVVR